MSGDAYSGVAAAAERALLEVRSLLDDARQQRAALNTRVRRLVAEEAALTSAVRVFGKAAAKLEAAGS